MSAELKRAVDDLFAQGDVRIGNVKFFRGRLATVTAEQLLEQIKSANDQIRRGDAKPLAMPTGV
jgi:hypothetical protein